MGHFAAKDRQHFVRFASHPKCLDVVGRGDPVRFRGKPVIALEAWCEWLEPSAVKEVSHGLKIGMAAFVVRSGGNVHIV